MRAARNTLIGVSLGLLLLVGALLTLDLAHSNSMSESLRTIWRARCR